MKKETGINHLKKMYEKLRAFKPPEFSDNEQLSNWIEAILEIDPYYAGLALTACEGGKISRQNLYNTKQLKKQLSLIPINNKEEERILDKCKEYISIIDEINTALEEMS